MQKLKNYYLYIFVLSMCMLGGIFLADLNAQTVESFRIIKGIPHLPVLASTASVSSPVPGMMIFSYADKTVMVYSGGAWDNFTTTTNVASSSNSKKYFQIINGIPVLPVMSTLTGAVRPGAMYYPSSGGGVRLNNGQEWKGPRDYVRGAEESDFNQVIAGRVNNVDGMIVFPVLSSAPKDVEAGAVYITNRFPRMKVFDGTNWLELAVDSYPNTPVPPVKIGNTTWAPVNAGYDNTHLYGLMYQWHRKYGQEYESANTYNGPVPLLIGKTLAVAVRFYYSASSPYDWSSTQQASWEMVDYNPCPTGWRVPTQAELEELRQAGSTWVDNGGPDDLPGHWYGGNHNTDRVGSVFLPASGKRDYSGGGARDQDTYGYYWSSTTSGTNAVSLNFKNPDSYIATNNYRAYGYSVRCVKESYAATITGATSFCEGGSVTLTASPGVSYSWNTGATTQSITASGPGTYTVTVTFPDGSSQEASILVRTLQWSDAGTLSGDQTICVGETTQFTASKSGGTWSSMNPSIASVNANGNVTGVKAGTTSIQYVWGSPCPGYVYRNVTVYDLPVLGGADSACGGTTAYVTPASGGTWTSSDVSVATVTNGGVVTAKEGGTTTLTFTDTTTGCSNTVTFTVRALPVITGPASVCEGGSVNILPDNGGVWTSSNTNVATVTDAGVVTGVSAGSTTLRFTDIATGCRNEMSFTVYALPNPKITYRCSSPYVYVYFSDLQAGGGSIQLIGPYTGLKENYSSTTYETSIVSSGGVCSFLVTGADGCSKSIVLDICCDTPFIGDKTVETCNGCFNVSMAAGDIVPAGTTFTWTAPTAAGVSGAHAGTNLSFVSDCGLTNTSYMVTPDSIVYTVTPKTGTCIGPPFKVTVLVKVPPVMNDVSNKTFCAGQSSNGISFTGGPPYSGITYTWTNSNTAIGLADKGTGNVPSFVPVNNTNSPITATITVTPEAFGCVGASKSFTITVNPELKTPIVDFDCFYLEGAPYHSLTITGLPAGGGAIIDKETGEKFPFGGTNPSVVIPAIRRDSHRFDFILEDANGCSLNFSFTLCCPDKSNITYKINCIPEHAEDDRMVMAHAVVQIDGLPDGGTITKIRPSQGKEEGYSGNSYIANFLLDGTHSYLVTDKNGCTKYVTFTTDCDPYDHLEYDWEITRFAVCGKDITSDIKIINLPADYWRIMPGEIVGGTVNGGVYEMLNMNPGDYTYSIYDKENALLGTLPVAIPYPSNGQQTTVILKNEDYNNKVGDLYFPEISAKNWRIKVGTYKEVEGSGTTYTVSKVPAGTYDVTVIDMDTQCQSEIKSVTICK